jgi:DNA (cytosine-5)-methyltransferase 1
MYTSLEICAGAGGQALGLEQAGFEHVALVEYEQEYCDCLRCNRPDWNVICMDVHHFDGKPYRGKIDLLSGGVPCPPFSVAGKQLGNKDERDLFPEMLRLVGEIQPKVVMIENVRGLMSSTFDQYRYSILVSLMKMGYSTHIQLLNASDYGVPQLRPRVIIIGVSNTLKDSFVFPFPRKKDTRTVGETLYDLMAKEGWKGADEWKMKADNIAPTIVGGSKKHGGADLGPTRARMAWAELGIDGRGVADEPPAKNFVGMPRLTPRMIARIQGFPDNWSFGDRKTKACRMIGNAFPPPVARAVGERIMKVLKDNRMNYGFINYQSKETISREVAYA